MNYEKCLFELIETLGTPNAFVQALILHAAAMQDTCHSDIAPLVVQEKET